MTGPTSDGLPERIAAALAPVAGVCAVALGGSRARGTHHPGSDYDIGLYYRGALDIAALERIAQGLNDKDASRDYRGGGPLMTGIGGWGEWVDGGGWLTVDGSPVDIIYRDLDRVARVAEESIAGRFSCAYHYGHPHAFVSTIYAGEIAICRPLRDPLGAIAALKARLSPYPQALRTAKAARFLDEARFFLAVAQKGAAQGDVPFVAGNLFRVEACLMQVLFAINREWLLNEKGALKMADGFVTRPRDLRARVENVFALSADPARLETALGEMTALTEETAGLA